MYLYNHNEHFCNVYSAEGLTII